MAIRSLRQSVSAPRREVVIVTASTSESAPALSSRPSTSSMPGPTAPAISTVPASVSSTRTGASGRGCGVGT
jgi:hypothetical protein